MSLARDIRAVKERLQSILDSSNVAITDKGGEAAADLSGLQAAIAGLKTGGTYQEKSVIPTGKEIVVAADSGYDALSKVTVAGDDNLKPWNLPEGITIYGVTGTMKINATSEIPEDLPVGKNDADEIYKENVGEAPADTGDLMVLVSSSGNITYGYLAEDFTITEFNPSTTDFKAKGWKRLSYHVNGPLAGTWTYDDFTSTESGGMNYLKNLRSCSREKLYYNGVEVWPNYPLIWSYNGERIPLLPDYDDKTYKHLVIFTAKFYDGSFGYVADALAEKPVIHRQLSSSDFGYMLRLVTVNDLRHTYFGTYEPSKTHEPWITPPMVSDGYTGRVIDTLTSEATPTYGILWASCDIYYADDFGDEALAGTLYRAADPNPIPVYE